MKKIYSRIITAESWKTQEQYANYFYFPFTFFAIIANLQPDKLWATLKYCCGSLRSLNKHKGLRKLFELGNTSGVQSQYSKRIKRILALLETAGTIEDMDLPDLKLHELRGDRSGIWSVKVGGNYRITFQIDAGDIYNVDYEDYALKGDFYENTQSSTPQRNNSGILRWSFGAQLQMERSYW